MIKKFALALVGMASITAASAQITYDGNISGEEYGSAIQTSVGGPSPSFGAGHELNALYAVGDTQALINFAIAGNVQSGNAILLFLDTKTGGYNTGNFGRAGAPEAVDEFRSGVTFDAGFFPDFVVRIGTNAAHDNFFLDLYTLSGSAGNGGGPNLYLGDAVASATFGAAPANGSSSQGFEFALSKTTLGYTEGANIGAFAAYVSDTGFLSNQFLTRAGSTEGSYGGGDVNFQNEIANAFAIGGSQIAQIPEPSSLSLLAGPAILGAWFFVRRRRA